MPVWPPAVRPTWKVRSTRGRPASFWRAAMPVRVYLTEPLSPSTSLTGAVSRSS